MLRKPAVGKNVKSPVQGAWYTRISSVAVWRALRCATSTAAPAMLGAVTGNHDFGWAALGGFEATLADLGGSYQARFAAMGLLSIGGAFGLFLGMISGSHLWSVLLCTVVWSFIWSYATVLGGTVSAFNALIIVIFLCGVETHVSSWNQAAYHALYLAAGAVWAMALALLPWPIHPYRPARVAVGQCYQGLASMLSSVLQLSGRKQTSPELWHRSARHHQYAMRNALENARAVIAATRGQQLAENIRGEQLLVLLETADVMLGYAITASEEAEQFCTNEHQVEVLATFLKQWRESLEWVRNTAVRDSMPSTTALEYQRERMRNLSSIADTSDSATLKHLSHVTADAMDVAIAAVFTVRTELPVRTGAAVPIGPSHRTISLPSRGMWRTLLAAWSWESLTLRHALRVSVVCGAGILMAASLRLQHGYWIPMTSVIVLRPHLAATWTRSLERTLGSAVGGILAAALIFFVRSKVLLAALLFPLSFATLALLPVNYALFVLFLTPTFVIASLSSVGDWRLAAVRAIYTTIGAAFALPAMYGLWPLWQHGDFLQRLAGYFQANVDYFATLVRSCREPGSLSPIEIARARRQTGLSNNAAEEALDQLLQEPKTDPRMRESGSTFVTYARRLAQSITALHNQPPRQYRIEDLQQLSELRIKLDQIVQGLRRGGLELSVQTPMPSTPWKASDQIAVLERQTSVLEDAAARLIEVMIGPQNHVEPEILQER
jgi:uncharacterized membrane protein YccC